MKKIIILSVSAFILNKNLQSQDVSSNQLQTSVAHLDRATSKKDYQQLAYDFQRETGTLKSQWLVYYYAAYCNAKTGWLNEEDPDNIELFANKAEEQIRQAQSLLDTATQKKELSEIYCILSMVNRARVFMNPSAYGPKYGPAASWYIQLALKSNPDNPRAIYLESWEKYSTPKIWGGDKVKAKELLEIARQKLNSESSSTVNPHWGRREVEELLQKLK